MRFKYRAMSLNGEMLEDFVEAQDSSRAFEILKAQGILVISLTAQDTVQNFSKASTRNALSAAFNFRVPLKTLVIFFRQLSTIINSGVNLSTGLNILSDSEENKYFKKILLEIQNDIGKGFTLTQAMKAQKVFNQLLISLIEAGEAGGRLGYALEQCAVLLEKQAALRNKVRSAMLYPSFVMLFAVGVVAFFFIFLVPKFEATFKNLNIELPAVTLKIFSMGDWFTAHWHFLSAGLLGACVLIYLLSKFRGTRGIMDRIKLKIPVIKNLVMKSSMARSSRTLSAMTSAGVPIAMGIEMAKGTAYNVLVENGYEELKENVIRGVSLGDAAKSAKIFPVLVSQMMRIGQETGHLDNMLERVASWYDQELDDQIKATVSLLEPVLVIIVGIIIAFIAVSVFAPITSAIVQLS